jgi:hypothetical protein
MAPRFSVLLPTHNRCHLLRLAVSSVLSQSERDFELLIVGDGCTDNSAAVIANFNDERIRWFDLPKAPFFGYANRNIALGEATGDYIAFIADDDLLFPDHLAALAATLEKSGAEWAYSRPLWVTTDGMVVPFASNLLHDDQLDKFLTLVNHIPASCVVYRHACINKYGYWPEHVPSAADWKYWIRIIEGGGRTNLGYCPVPTALHFNALWKTTPDTQMPQVTAARELSSTLSWWPASLSAHIPLGVPEQQVFFEIIQTQGYIDLMRRDVMEVVDRLAWVQLDHAPETHARLHLEIAKLKAELEHTKHGLLDTQQRLSATIIELSDLKPLMAKQREELLSQEEKIADAAAIISERTKQLDSLQIRFYAMLASNSWRATAPLRALRNTIRRAVNR